MLILGLPAMLLILVEGTDVLARWLGERFGRRQAFGRWARWAVVGLGCLASLVTLRFYYSYPKQDYRNSVEYVERARQPDGVVIVVAVAESGFRYYGNRVAPGRIIESMALVKRCHSESRSTRACWPLAVIR